MSVKVCEKCHREFSGDELDKCPMDGGRLFAVVDESPLTGRVIDGRYEVRELIGQGGMGQVYHAFQLSMKRDIALKVLPLEMAADKEAVRRFLKEAQAVSRISHPNAITVYDFGQTPDGVLYLAMEYIRGLTLAERLQETGPMSPTEACDIVGQVCNALEEAHGLGIVHRDLKPDNIMLMKKAGHRSFAKVLDFGLAKIRFGEGESHTQTGLICGTPHYMSPEQVMGEAVDGRADLYAAGIILFELLTGQPPFDAASPMAIAMKHLKNEPPPIRTNDSQVMVPLDLQALILKCLSKERRDRYDDASQLRAALIAVSQNLLTRSPKSVALKPIKTGISQILDSEGGAPTTEYDSQQLLEAEKNSAPEAMTPSMLSSVSHRSPWISWKVLGPLSVLLAVVLLVIAAPWASKHGPQDKPKIREPKIVAIGAMPKKNRKTEPKLRALGPKSQAKKAVRLAPLMGARAPLANGPSTKKAKIPLPGTRLGKREVLPSKKIAPVVTPPTKDPRKSATGTSDNTMPVARKMPVVPETIVSLQLKTSPLRVAVYLDGKRRGLSPLTLKVNKARSPVKIKFVRRGYVTKTLSWRPLENRTITVALQKRKPSKPSTTPDSIFRP